MLTYQRTDGCRMQFLREQLDDPGAAPCGRCDNCGGLELVTSVAEKDVAAARELLSVPGVSIAPRAMWPSGMKSLGISLSGKIAPTERAEPGRAVGRLDGLGWGNDLRDLLKGPDVETPVPLRHAAVDVLKAWPESRTVDGVIGVHSMTRPELSGHLGYGLARFLGVEYLGTCEPLTEPQSPDVNSAQRLKAVAERFEIPALDLTGKRLLLVDDVTRSGWTLTVLARLLRRAGAEAVFPFALAVG